MTFAPSTRRIYVRSVRVAFGLQVLWPPRPPRGCLLCGSCSSGQSFVFGFLPASPREATVTVQLGVPSHRGPQGTLTPKSLPARLSPHGYCPPIGGPRHAWRTNGGDAAHATSLFTFYVTVFKSSARALLSSVRAR